MDWKDSTDSNSNTRRFHSPFLKHLNYSFTTPVTTHPAWSIRILQRGGHASTHILNTTTATMTHYDGAKGHPKPQE